MQEGAFEWTAKEFIIATLKGVSQVTFVENWKTGVFWVVGLTLAFQLPPVMARGAGGNTMVDQCIYRRMERKLPAFLGRLDGPFGFRHWSNNGNILPNCLLQK